MMEYDADIFDAIEFGDLETVELYWSEKTNIDFQDNDGITLIMLATRYNHKEIVDYLLKFSPNLSLKNKKEETVFQMAEQLKDKEIFYKLIRYQSLKIT